MHALRNSKDHCINYEHPQGNLELRKQIAKLAFNWGGKIKPDEVVVTNGCLEAITMCLRAVTQPGDTVAVESPNYFGIFQAIESMGLKVVEISSCFVSGLDLDCLEAGNKKISRSKPAWSFRISIIPWAAACPMKIKKSWWS